VMRLIAEQEPLQDFSGTYRFFKFFLPLGAIDGFKKLNSIAFLSERSRDFSNEESYAGTWYWECLNPQSYRLNQDVQTFGSMNWLLAVPQIRKGEPIHYRYLLSPAGLLELSRRKMFETIAQKVRENSFTDYVSDLAALNAAPVSWLLALTYTERPLQGGNVPYANDLERTDGMNHVSDELLENLGKFYSSFYGTENVRHKRRRLTVTLTNSDYAVGRYEYLRKDLWDGLPSKHEIEEQLDAMPADFVRRASINESGIRQRLEAKRKIIDAEHEVIEEQFDHKLRDARQYYDDIVELGGQLGLTFEQGKVKLELSKQIRDGPVKRSGTSLIWNLLQPLEVSRLIRYYGLEWVTTKLTEV